MEWAEARRALHALYAEVDLLFAGATCDQTSECCRFGITGREPYPTAVELTEIECALREKGIMLSRMRRRDSKLPMAEKPCPLLSEDGKCRIYASRPFGCRTFFCDRASMQAPVRRATVQEISHRIADLSARFSPRDPHARPLTRALGTTSRG